LTTENGPVANRERLQNLQSLELYTKAYGKGKFRAATLSLPAEITRR